jgi:ComEC/Rec2-related protein
VASFRKLTPVWGAGVSALYALIALIFIKISPLLLFAPLIATLCLIKRNIYGFLMILSLVLGYLCAFISYKSYLTETTLITGQTSDTHGFLLKATGDSVTAPDASHIVRARLLKSRSFFTETSASGALTVYLNDTAKPAIYKGELFFCRTALKESAGGQIYLNVPAAAVTYQGFASKLYSSRAALKEKLTTLLNRKLNKAYGLFMAFTLGDKNALSPILDNAFKVSGLSHILALSGYHVAVLSAVIFLIFRKISYKAALIISLPVILCYLILSGFQYSLSRAVIMAFMAAVFYFKKHAAAPLDLLGLTFLILITTDGTAFTSHSFRLSFLAMAGIFMLTEKLTGLLNTAVPGKFLKTKQNLAIGLAAQSLTAPYCLAAFGQFAPLAFLTTLIMAPLLGIFILISLTAIIIPVALTAQAADLAYTLIYETALFFAAFPFIDLNWL